MAHAMQNTTGETFLTKEDGTPIEEGVRTQLPVTGGASGAPGIDDRTPIKEQPICRGCGTRFDPKQKEGDEDAERCYDCVDEMDEDAAEAVLMDALLEYCDDDHTLDNLETFESAGIMTRNKGICLRIDGVKFQLTIVQD